MILDHGPNRTAHCCRPLATTVLPTAQGTETSYLLAVQEAQKCGAYSMQQMRRQAGKAEKYVLCVLAGAMEDLTWAVASVGDAVIRWITSFRVVLLMDVVGRAMGAQLAVVVVPSFRVERMVSTVMHLAART